MSQRTITTLLMLLVLAGVLSCKDELPQSDQIPKIQAALYAVQQAVRADDVSTLHALMTKKARRQGRGDSLIALVSVFDYTRPFARFVDSNIFYNQSIAQIECYAVDSLDSVIVPLNLIFMYDKDRWWLHSFTEAVKEDSI